MHNYYQHFKDEESSPRSNSSEELRLRLKKSESRAPTLNYASIFCTDTYLKLLSTEFMILL